LNIHDIIIDKAIFLLECSFHNTFGLNDDIQTLAQAKNRLVELQAPLMEEWESGFKEYCLKMLSLQKPNENTRSDCLLPLLCMSLDESDQLTISEITDLYLDILPLYHKFDSSAFCDEEIIRCNRLISSAAIVLWERGNADGYFDDDDSEAEHLVETSEDDRGAVVANNRNSYCIEVMQLCSYKAILSSTDSRIEKSQALIAARTESAKVRKDKRERDHASWRKHAHIFFLKNPFSNNTDAAKYVQAQLYEDRSLETIKKVINGVKSEMAKKHK